MDALNKLMRLSRESEDEVGEEIRQPPQGCPGAAGAGVDPASLPIHMAVLPNGQRVPMLKTLLSSVCERNCYYCTFRAGHDFPRLTFTPDELAHTYMDLWRKGVVKGIFLSSGVAGGGIHTQDRLLDTAEILRFKLGYRDYLHLKVMPGSERAQVERAMQLADRVSINLEAPNTERLNQLAPMKRFLDELLQPLRWVEEIRQRQAPLQAWKGRWPSSTTQFVVGGVGESDLELMRATEYLYRQLKLARAYYSGFHPVAGTPLEGQAPLNPWREHRLYQASFLLRDYGFALEDLPFESSGNLPVETDPKLAWARLNLSQAPVEVNRAGRNDLLRVPGIGRLGAEAILRARRQGRLRSLADLSALGVRAGRAAPFILLDGHRPAQQLALW